ncbi:hypothetical protein Q3G72_010610 [Acer saccharum]|nr:hypothetical protein Q3G72_010610 [Acer saccharum]
MKTARAIAAGHKWFSMKLQHAVIVWLAIYTSQKLYRKPNMDGRYTDKLYLQTLYHMIDLGRITNWSVTHVDWSEGKWHPKAYRAQDVTFGLLKSIAFIDESVHVTSNEMLEQTRERSRYTDSRSVDRLMAPKKINTEGGEGDANTTPSMRLTRSVSRQAGGLNLISEFATGLSPVRKAKSAKKAEAVVESETAAEVEIEKTTEEEPPMNEKPPVKEDPLVKEESLVKEDPPVEKQHHAEEKPEVEEIDGSESRTNKDQDRYD